MASSCVRLTVPMLVLWGAQAVNTPFHLIHAHCMFRNIRQGADLSPGLALQSSKSQALDGFNLAAQAA